MTTVGIIANPAAGKDIRRLVAQGRFVPNQEKVNILKRVLAGLDAVGVERVVFMPDVGLLGRGAMDGMRLGLKVEFLEMTIFNEENDSTRAARLMADIGVGCLITLGGDGTNRAVAKGSGSVPLVPVSTGTNNVFPSMVEGTLAGLAAGVVACGLVDLAATSTVSKRLEIFVDGELADIALVDLAVSKERFVGARAIWDMDTIHEVFLARAEPASIGLSAIGAQLQPTSVADEHGMYLKIGPGGAIVLAPVVPGMVIPVEVERWRVVQVGESMEIGLKPCTIALDGERAFTVRETQEARVSLSRSGPLVVSVEAALREAALNGVFTQSSGVGTHRRGRGGR
ncbi:MAG: NAD(+)/NADH kinase [Chloroflexi bacterium]|nr:NAD(+)/NADH kinase [Chloroflexota bacterium]